MRDRNGKASRDIGKQYIKWVDTFASPYLKKDPTDAEPYISGERCWQLRCSIYIRIRALIMRMANRISIFI